MVKKIFFFDFHLKKGIKFQLNDFLVVQIVSFCTNVFGFKLNFWNELKSIISQYLNFDWILIASFNKIRKIRMGFSN